MFDSLAWMIDEVHWLWWVGGVLLLAGEMLVPGVYLLWIGLASLLTGVFAWLMPGLGFEGHGLIFAGFAAASIYIGHQYFYSRRGPVADAEVNTRGSKHIGEIYTVAEEIKNGRGHVAVRDSRWLAQGPDAAVGDQVRVISVEGTVLVVEAVEE